MECMYDTNLSNLESRRHSIDYTTNTSTMAFTKCGDTKAVSKSAAGSSDDQRATTPSVVS
jgi:hypothetical protein